MLAIVYIHCRLFEKSEFAYSFNQRSALYPKHTVYVHIHLHNNLNTPSSINVPIFIRQNY